MKIELKNIHHSEKLSEETNAFSANLYIEGKMVGTASNNGHGGSTGYRANDVKGQKLIADAEIYCKGLPPIKFNSGGEDHFLDMDLEGYIDELVDKYLQDKYYKQFQKKIKSDMEKGIVVGIPDKSYVLWKFNMPLEKIIAHPKGPDLLKKALIKDIISTLINGNKILNTNIPLSIFQAVGLNENHYIKQFTKDDAVNKNMKRPGRKL
ncbi:MAG: hypothetical protein J7577_23225 [Sphingobacteriaceae bacterium]|nr:hypothetical protein [Sphingobacteriaceae bacterium]